MKVIATSPINSKIQLIAAEDGVLSTYGTQSDINGKTCGKFCLEDGSITGIYFDNEDDAMKAFNDLHIKTRDILAFHAPSVVLALSMVGCGSFTRKEIADDFIATICREKAIVADEWLNRVHYAIINHFIIEDVEKALKL